MVAKRSLLVLYPIEKCAFTGLLEENIFIGSRIHTISAIAL
jgi:hypothetical protein